MVLEGWISAFWGSALGSSDVSVGCQPGLDAPEVGRIAPLDLPTEHQSPARSNNHPLPSVVKVGGLNYADALAEWRSVYDQVSFVPLQKVQWLVVLFYGKLDLHAWFLFG